MRYELSFLCFQSYSKPKNFGPWKDQYYFKETKRRSKIHWKCQNSWINFLKILAMLNFKLSKWVNIYQIHHHLNSVAFLVWYNWLFLEFWNCSSALFRAELFSKPMRDNILITRCYLGLEFSPLKLSAHVKKFAKTVEII